VTIGVCRRPRWALPSGRQIGRPLVDPEGVGPVSLRPDGRTPAVRHLPQISIIDVATRRRRTALSRDDTIYDVERFTPDGRFIVGVSDKARARLWSVETGKPVTGTFGGPAGAVISASVSRTDARSPQEAPTARSGSGTCPASGR
jgi:hypothetical protein